eukprot:12764440-Heterocapsa_arctica.AAC.1
MVNEGMLSWDKADQQSGLSALSGNSSSEDEPTGITGTPEFAQDALVQDIAAALGTDDERLRRLEGELGRLPDLKRIAA